MRVVVQGRLKPRSYETREGEKRTVFEIDVDEVGPSLKYATAKVTRTTRSGGGGGFSGGGRAAARAAPRAGERPVVDAGPQPAGQQSRPAVGGQQGGGSAGPNDPWGAPGVAARRSPPSDPPAPDGRMTDVSNHRTIRHQPHHSGVRRAFTKGSTTMAKAVIRKPKKKVCQFCKEKATGVDYKDTTLLRKFISDRGKIRARRVTGNCVQHQRDVAIAVKNAREVALLPYTSTGR